ncbi:hypothetical protein, partial [Salmonella enterica]|uniref:hypothetical protein n=1 Tax=Salmonella enterica TaxID=28901 RepID=UPI0009CB3776
PYNPLSFPLYIPRPGTIASAPVGELDNHRLFPTIESSLIPKKQQQDIGSFIERDSTIILISG